MSGSSDAVWLTALGNRSDETIFQRKVQLAKRLQATTPSCLVYKMNFYFHVNLINFQILLQIVVFLGGK